MDIRGSRDMPPGEGSLLRVGGQFLYVCDGETGYLGYLFEGTKPCRQHVPGGLLLAGAFAPLEAYFFTFPPPIAVIFLLVELCQAHVHHLHFLRLEVAVQQLFLDGIIQGLADGFPVGLQGLQLL